MERCIYTYKWHVGLGLHGLIHGPLLTNYVTVNLIVRMIINETKTDYNFVVNNHSLISKIEDGDGIDIECDDGFRIDVVGFVVIYVTKRLLLFDVDFNEEAASSVNEQATSLVDEEAASSVAKRTASLVDRLAANLMMLDIANPVSLLKGHIALATTTSCIAVSILPGGRTAHVRFKIPLDSIEGSGCRISKQSSLASLTKDSKLVIWDEAPMVERSEVEALNVLLQDIINSTELFVDPSFTKFLLKIGNGTKALQNNDLVNISPSMLIQTHSDKDPLDALIDSVYPSIQLKSLTTSCSLNRVILTTKNCFVDGINEILITRFPGEETKYCSFDETIDPNDQT
ncbi:ATP-dependent DNA helicase RRM3-like protein [Tanacetum coccineum]